MLSGKTVLLGITGGIAAYKICELIRMYKRANAEVLVVCTQNALNFVTKLTLENLSKNPVAVEEFNVEKFNPEHISYADRADIMVIAPATANTISKIATGVCDNLLTSIACAFTKPMIIAPAMNCNMWENPIIQQNLNKLNVEILEPESGYLACGYEGKGRLCSLDKIFDKTVEVLNSKKLDGKKVVITSGGTIEEIDPVRYITNHSTGKMGYAIAKVAMERGADVTLISGITSLEKVPFVNTIDVVSAEDMFNAVVENYDNADIVIKSAAVADFTPENVFDEKVKKSSGNMDTIKLKPTKDIIKYLGEHKENQFLCGFSMETENMVENSRDKLTRKNLDMIVANNVKVKGAGFGTDTNVVTIITKDNEETLPIMTKEEVAEKLLDRIVEKIQ